MYGVKLIPFQVNEIMAGGAGSSAGVEMIKAREVWKDSDRGRSVVIAVIDTGCQMDHPDLKGNIIGGRNFTSDHNRDAGNYNDNNGHGTHVAGIIAAADNGKGTTGVAPEAKLLILKSLSKDGSGGYREMIQAIDYAIQWRGKKGERVRVLSMSLGSTIDHPMLHRAIMRAVDQGILVVCAAGNLGDGNAETEEKHYPGGYSEVIQVGAVDTKGKMAYFSNTNNEVDLVAPGVDILSTYIDSKYAVLSGTSMAAPHVSGAAALIINQCEKDFGRSLSEAELYAQICKRTRALGYSKWEEGNGLLVLTEGYQNTPVVEKVQSGWDRRRMFG